MSKFVKRDIRPGSMFHKWKVLEEVAPKGKRRIFRCRCTCGTIKNVEMSNLGRKQGCHKCRDNVANIKNMARTKANRRKLWETFGRECHDCLETKPIEEFAISSGSYRKTICKSCDSARGSERYRKKMAEKGVAALPGRHRFNGAPLAPCNPGDRYGKLEIVQELPSEPFQTRQGKTKNRRFVEAKCDCGNVFKVRLESLRNGNTKSCGCTSNLHRRKHQPPDPEQAPWAR